MTSKDKNISSLIGIAIVTIVLLLVDLGPRIFGDDSGIFSRKINLGLDLQGGTQLTYRVDLTEALPTQRVQILDGVKSVIENRVNSIGVAEPYVYTSEAGDTPLLIVELPGIKDKEEALARIGKVVDLEFMEEKRFYDDEELIEIQAANEKVMESATAILNGILEDSSVFDEHQKLDSVSSPEPKTRAESNLPDAIRDALSEIQPGEINPSLFPVGDRRIILRLDKIEEREVEAPAVGAISFETETGEGEKTTETVDTEVETTTEKLYTYSEIAFDLQSETPRGGWAKTGLTGAQFEFADVSFDEFGRPTITISFDDEGAELFAEITERNIDKPIAIFIDGYPADLSQNEKINQQNTRSCRFDKVIAEDGEEYCPYAPVVQTAITDGRAIITGRFTQVEAHNIAKNLNTGAIPAPVTLIGQQSVGATLGNEALQTGVKAGLLGLAIVALFMLAYYRLSGLLAVSALVIYTITVFAAFKVLGVTLTLAGIAGFILSIGMAVDANILIFERMKEEFRRGKGFQDALNEGFVRAWSAIRDSNLSSLITCAILFIFGSGAVRGFAVTLAIGILISMATAIFVTRQFLETFASTKLAEKKNLWVGGIKKND